MTPWLNSTTGDTKLEELKKFSFFLPPKTSGSIDNLFVVSQGECSSQFEFRPHLEPKLLSSSGLSIDEFEACIGRINSVMSPLKEAHSLQEKLIVYYILFGILVITSLAIYIGIKVSYIISIVMAVLYFAGFIYLVLRVQQKNSYLVKKIHFNLAVVLRNENDRLLVPHGIKARPGYLSKWIEFHQCVPGKGTLNRRNKKNDMNGSGAQLVLEDEESMFSREN